MCLVLLTAAIVAAPTTARCDEPGKSDATTPGQPTARAERPLTVVIYTRRGCRHCAEAKAFLSSLALEVPALRVVERVVDEDPAARRELDNLVRRAHIDVPGVPMFVVGSEIVVGFEDAATTGARLRELLHAARSEPSRFATRASVCSPERDTPCEEPRAAPLEVNTRLFGRLSASRLGLPLFTLTLGLLDGFNPCAMWVLVFLLAMLAGQRDRSRLAVIGATFVLASGVVYYAFMSAWLNVFLFIGLSRQLQIVLGFVALGVGALNTKDFVAFRSGPSLSIPEGAKPAIYARVRRVMHAKTLVASAVGVAVLAVLVNFVELLCTAGFPAVYTSVLAQSKLSALERAAYLGLYNLAYVADDTLMVTLAVVTLSRRRLSEAAGRWLKLASGVVMLGLGLALLLRPGWLV